MVNTWYVAPDNTTVPGVTVVATGTAGYANSWTTCGKWSDFIASGGVWNAKYQSGDTLVMLPGIYLSTAFTWGTGLKSTTGSQIFNQMNVTALWPSGAVGFAYIKGDRTSPWPFDAVAAGANTGATFLTINTSTHTVSNFSNIHWVNWGGIVVPGLTNGAPLGVVNFTNCYATNFEQGGGYASSNVLGQLDTNVTDVVAHGYARGWYRGWGSYKVKGFVGDSEFQATTRTTSAASTSAFNSFDANVAASVTNHPCRVENAIGRNHAAGSVSAGNYPQGDFLIGEENVIDIQLINIKAYGSGDRNVDLKCGGHGTRIWSYGAGFGHGHHLDTTPANYDQSYFGTSFRPLTSSAAAGSVQMSGYSQSTACVLIQKPTAAMAAAAGYSIFVTGCDPSKFQHDMYGSFHAGRSDNFSGLVVYSAANATLTGGSNAGDANCIQNWPVFGAATGTGPWSVGGLAASTSYVLKTRAVDSSGTAGPWSPTYTVTTGTNTYSGADVTKPPTPAAPTSVTGGSNYVTYNFAQVTQDSGVAIQGYLAYITMPGDTVPIFSGPGKSASPGKIWGLTPGTSYTLYLASYDGNMNVSDLSTGVGFSTTGTAPGTTIGSNTPAQAQFPGGMTTTTDYTVDTQAKMLALSATVGKTAARTDTGQTFTLTALPASTLGNWSAATGIAYYNPRMVGISVPAAVTNAVYYEVGLSSGTVIGRMHPTQASFSTTLTQTNMTVATTP